DDAIASAGPLPGCVKAPAVRAEMPQHAVGRAFLAAPDGKAKPLHLIDIVEGHPAVEGVGARPDFRRGLAAKRMEVADHFQANVMMRALEDVEILKQETLSFRKAIACCSFGFTRNGPAPDQGRKLLQAHRAFPSTRRPNLSKLWLQPASMP